MTATTGYADVRYTACGRFFIRAAPGSIVYHRCDRRGSRRRPPRLRRSSTLVLVSATLFFSVQPLRSLCLCASVVRSSTEAVLLGCH